MAIADLEKIVKIVFAGDNTSLDKTIASVSSGLKGIETTVKDATQPFADLTQQILKIDAALALLAVGGLVIATKAAGDFGDSFSEISTLIDVPKAKLGDFKNDILDYATTSTQSIEDINKSIYNAISAGEDYTTALDLLSAAETLAIATKAELNTAIEILRPTLNAFGLTTKEAGDFADILFTAVKNGKLTLTELEPVLANVTGIAAASGVSFDQVASALAALTAAGLPVNLAVTQLKGALTGIFAPAKDAAKVAGELGIEFGKNALEGKTLNEVFALMVEKTGGTLEGMKALIPRVEGASAALILGRDAGGKYADTLDAMSERAGAATVAFEKMKDNFELINQGIINNIQATLIKVGIPLLDDWAAVAKGIGEVFKGVTVGFDAGAFDGLIGIAEKIAADLALEFEGIAKALPEALKDIDFKDFETALKDLVDTGKELLNNLFGGLDLTKPEDLQKAIQKVVDAFTNWVALTEGIVAGLTPFLTKISELAGWFADLDEDTAKLAGQFLGWATAINVAAGAIVVVTAPLTLLAATFKILSLTRIPAMIVGIKNMVPALGLGTAGLAGALGIAAKGAAAFGLGWTIGTLIKDVPVVKQVGESLGQLGVALFGSATQAANAMEKQALHTKAMGDAAVAIVRAKEGIIDINAIDDPEVKIDLLLEDFYGDIDAFTTILGDIQNAPTTVKVDADTSKAKTEVDKTMNYIETVAADGTTTRFYLDSTGAVTKAQDTKAAIDKELPHEKLMEIKLQGEIDIEIADIKAQAETLQTAFEWNAKVEIANVEAAAKEIEAIAGTIEAAWQSTGDVISAALGVLNQDLSGIRWLDVIKIIDREQDLQEEIWETQKLLVEAQTAMIVARTAALAKGEPIITITTDGLEPELEQVLYSIVQKAQIKANEEGFAALLGI